MAVCLPLLACATIVQGRTQRIAINSVPPGAQIFVGNDLVGITPAEVNFKRRRRVVNLRFEKEGYRPVAATLKRVASGWLVGDAAWSGIQFANQGVVSESQRLTAVAGVAAVTFGIDFATGSAYKLTPGEVRVTLTAAPDSPAESSDP